MGPGALGPRGPGPSGPNGRLSFLSWCLGHPTSPLRGPVLSPCLPPSHGSHSRSSLPPSVHSRETPHRHQWPPQCPPRGPLALQSRTNLGWRDHRRVAHCSLQGITAYRPPPTGTKTWAATRKPSRAAGPPLDPGRMSAQGAGPGGHTRGHQRERARGRARRGAVQNDHALSCGTSGPGASGGRVCHLVLCATHGLPQDLPACLPTLRGGEGQWRNALPITAAQLSPFHPGPPGPPGTARQRTAAARHPGPGLGRRRVQALWGPSGSLPPWRTK